MRSFFSRSASLTLAFILFPLSNFQAHARWLLEDEVDIECSKNKTSYKVKKDGTWVMESEIELKILTEAGRQALSTQTYSYDSTNSVFKVNEAKTSFDGKDIIVPKENIEDKPLASDSLGLEKKHQVLIPFECVAVGSTLHLKLEKEYFHSIFEGYFYESIGFCENFLYKHTDVTIESALPLFVKINDPRDSLDFIELKDDLKHVLNFRLKKPIIETLANEAENSFLEPANRTSFSISTEKDYARIGKLEAKLYQSALNEPLPTDLENIRDSASKIESETECIDMVVSYLIENITYLGSWNTAEGHLAPRSLGTIITSGYGDCKEYATCLAAVLNKLGYKANIAVVFRGDVYLESDMLPNIEQFNHAIVKAVGPSGKTYWIDPTNAVSMADGIFPDIADRPAGVLDLENPTYERIPPIDYKHAVSKTEQTITITHGDVQTVGAVCLEGESAKALTESLTKHPRSLVKEVFIRRLCIGNEPVVHNVDFSDFNPRQVIPLQAKYSFGEMHVMLRTNYGHAFPLISNWYQPYITASPNSEGSLYVGHPETIIAKKVFKNVSTENLNSLAFSIQSPWLNAKRELFSTDEGIEIIQIIEKLKSIIPAKDLKSDEFKKLKTTLLEYCDGVAIIFSKVG